MLPSLEGSQEAACSVREQVVGAPAGWTRTGCRCGRGSSVQAAGDGAVGGGRECKYSIWSSVMGAGGGGLGDRASHDIDVAFLFLVALPCGPGRGRSRRALTT